MTNSLAFADLRGANATRNLRWFASGRNEWSHDDWLVSLGGEIGEALNIVKKMQRDRLKMRGNAEAWDQLLIMLGDELADVVIYLDVLASHFRTERLAQASPFVIRDFERLRECTFNDHASEPAGNLEALRDEALRTSCEAGRSASAGSWAGHRSRRAVPGVRRHRPVFHPHQEEHLSTAGAAASKGHGVIDLVMATESVEFTAPARSSPGARRREPVDEAPRPRRGRGAAEDERRAADEERIARRR
jgi:NTP pyrophosphatase (non-canonical NTP hydrolase)